MRKLQFKFGKYFPHYFIADVVLYSVIVWWVSRLFINE